jgi:hypothetical protein
MKKKQQKMLARKERETEERGKGINEEYLTRGLMTKY